MAITRGINHIGLTVPDMEEATRFFKEGLDGKIAYDSQTKTEEPRGGRHVEHILYKMSDSHTFHSMWKRKTLTMHSSVFKRLEARLCLIHIVIHGMRILKGTKLFTLKRRGVA